MQSTVDSTESTVLLMASNLGAMEGILLAFSFIVAIIAMLFIIIRRLVFGDPVAGWASTVVIILFIGGIQLLSIGILGLYLSKLYLEAKDRPIYLIGESNIEKPTGKY